MDILTTFVVGVSISIIVGFFGGYLYFRNSEQFTYKKTLVIETYDTTFHTSRYEVKKFASIEDREMFIYSHMKYMMKLGFNQDVSMNRLVNQEQDTYIVYHEID